jgi:hypothetical protein
MSVRYKEFESGFNPELKVRIDDPEPKLDNQT